MHAEQRSEASLKFSSEIYLICFLFHFNEKQKMRNKRSRILWFVMVQPGTKQKVEMLVQFLMVLLFKFFF